MKSVVCLRLSFLAALIAAGAVFVSQSSPMARAASGASMPAVALPPAGPGLGSDAAPASGTVAAAAGFGKLPVYFIPNAGQVDDCVSFYVRGSDKTIYFAPEGVTFSLASGREADADPLLDRSRQVPREATTPASETPRARWNVKLDFLGADPAVRPHGIEKSGAIFSYFTGPREKWHAGLSGYTRISYENLWPGIDLAYGGTVDRIKYEFVLRPGADPSRIRLAYRGADSVKLNADGQIEVMTPAGGFTDDVPVAWQEVGGERKTVEARYVLVGSEYGFELGAYDPSLPLVIDPVVLVYCGFLGGSGFDSGNGIAVDSAGNAYVTGYTSSTAASFPLASGPDLTYNGGGYDAFVAKVASTGTSLIYCGFIGGSGSDAGNGIAVDTAGNAYVIGFTDSTEASFPVVTGPDLTYNGGGYDAFVAKVAPTGATLSYSGFIGGSSWDVGMGIAVDSTGSAFVTGYAVSTEASFPVVGGPDLTHNGSYDAFVASVTPDGTGLGYCGFIGGSDYEIGLGIAVDSAGDAYVTGTTHSTEATFSVVGGPDLTSNGGDDAFIAKVTPGGTSLSYSGFVGGSGDDNCLGIAIDSAGNAYVTGYTYSTEASFPVVLGPDLTFNGLADAFVAKVTPGGTGLDYCGFIGGSDEERGTGVAVDSAGNAYITGYTYSTETSFPVVGGPDLTFNGGLEDAFVAKVTPSGGSLGYSGFIGGSGADRSNAVAVDSAGNTYVIGNAYSTEVSFPVVGGPDLTSNGFADAFVAKIAAGGVITTIKSKKGTPGATATIRGSDFSATKSNNIVHFGTKIAAVKKASATMLKVTIPRLKRGKTVDVYVVVNGASSNVVPFTVR